MGVLTKIGVIFIYTLLVVLTIWLAAKIANLLIKAVGITAKGMADGIRIFLYILGIFGSIWLIFWLWDKYGKDLAKKGP